MTVAGRSLRLMATMAALALLFVCMLLPENSVLRPLDAAVLTLGTALAAWYLSLVFRKALEHERLARRLQKVSKRATRAGVDVQLVDGFASPFVAGLFRPAIYCPTTLADRITRSELQAVLSHEQQHRLTYAPLRLVVIDALEAAFPIRSIQKWATRERAAIEIEADRHAMAAGADQATIASALLSLAITEVSSAAGFGAATEIRLRALIDGNQARPATHGLAFAVITLLASLVCVALYLL